MMEDECSQWMAVAFEPQGGPSGTPWDDGVYFTIRRFVVYHGNCIDAIEIDYNDKDGKLSYSAKHGGCEGEGSEFALAFPDEYLISIHGYSGDIYDKNGNPTNVIRSLTLESNTKTYGPFGVEEGTKFSFPTTGAKIVGFRGKSGWYLDSIGFYVLPLPIQK